MKPIQYTFLIVVWLLWLRCGTNEITCKPEMKSITSAVYASGNVKSKQQYQVFSKANGIIKKVMVHEGDLVKKGQAVYVLSNDISTYQKDNASLVAQFADQQSNREKLQTAKLQVDIAQKKMQQEKLLLSRQQNLWNQQIGTQLELEQRELSVANAVTAYQSAMLAYQELEKQLAFNAAQSKKNVQISTAQLADYTISSEIQGKVYDLLKEQGEYVSPQTPLAIIGDSDDFMLTLQVDENDIIKIKTGQKVIVTLESYPGQTFEAMVSAINPIMNERTRSFEVEAVFMQQPPTLYPNLTVEANIVLATKQQALLIPRNYLVDEQYVMISPSQKRLVKTGLKDYQMVEIIDGLTLNEKIYQPK